MTNVGQCEWFKYDRDWTKKHEAIKKDPYRYILSKREHSKCYNRLKRTLFTGGFITAYLYYNIRHHQELGLIKGLRLSRVFYYQTMPKVAVFGLLTFAFGYTFFVDFEKRKMHDIAKLELMKFDETWFTHDDYRYCLSGAPVYQSPESKFGRKSPIRGFADYYQLPGYLVRRRALNPDIVKETPPKYEFTPAGPREGQDFEKMLNKVPRFLASYN